MSTLSLTCQVTRSKTLLLHLISKSAGLTVSPQLLEMAGMADKSFHSFMNTVNPQHFLSVLWVLGPRAGCWWLGTERRALHRRGSRGVGETLRSILCTKAVAEALWPHPVLLHPPWPVHLCPLPVALSFPGCSPPLSGCYRNPKLFFLVLQGSKMPDVYPRYGADCGLPLGIGYKIGKLT